uniref:Uncharacterized protein n=1 Tax=Setaria italica TaxID=4555 RepID=K3Z1M8_SETIT
MLTSGSLRWLGLGWTGHPKPKNSCNNTGSNTSTDGTVTTRSEFI